MENNMAILTITIRETGDGSSAAEALRPLVCPYLQAFGGAAKMIADRRFRELKGDAESHRVAMFDVELSGAPAEDLAETARKLERHLKQAAKDANLAATFGMLLLLRRTDEQSDSP
jgi:hypothetical protein